MQGDGKERTYVYVVMGIQHGKSSFSLASMVMHIPPGCDEDDMVIEFVEDQGRTWFPEGDLTCLAVACRDGQAAQFERGIEFLVIDGKVYRAKDRLR